MINILLLVSLPTFCLSQEKEEKDSVTLKNFVPTGIRIGTDALALIRNGYDDTFNGWEVNADIDFHRYFLAVDVGSWQRAFDSEEGRYSNDGTYFRVGADVNFLTKDPYKNVLFFGARYARSVFSENLHALVTDPVWGDAENDYSNIDATATWFELTGGLRVRIWKFLWLGYTARFKFGLGTGGTSMMIPHDIPGYGINDKKSTWGFNYQVLFRLPFRSEKQNGS